MKKTILVVYTASQLSEQGLESKSLPRYAFNTESTVEIGDMFKSEAYSTPMQVCAVLDTEYKYYNPTTGELSNTLNSTKSRKIKDIRIEDAPTTETILAYKC